MGIIDGSNMEAVAIDGNAIWKRIGKKIRHPFAKDQEGDDSPGDGEEHKPGDPDSLLLDEVDLVIMDEEIDDKRANGEEEETHTEDRGGRLKGVHAPLIGDIDSSLKQGATNG